MAMAKKAVVIYDTKFGNTEKIAKAVARGIEEQGVTVACLKVEDVDPDTLGEYDFLALGGPTHGFGISKPMKDFLTKLETGDLRAKRAFAFDTKFGSRFAGSAAKGIENRLKTLGMNIVRSRSSAFVKGPKGPLDENMIEKFRKIGVELAETP